MKDFLSPKQVALAMGVSEASLKRWCDKGVLTVTRTPGGHRRLPIDSVMEFLRRSGHQLVRPEVLGLPPATGKNDKSLDQSRDEMIVALEGGDEDQVVRLGFNLYLGGKSIATIGDRVIAPAFRAIGSDWETRRCEVYQEHRAVEICSRLLYQFRQAIPAVVLSAALAIGGTLEGDPYTLAATLVALTLRENGWRAESYGPNHPAGTLCAAIRDVRPRLLWLSISAMVSAETFLAQYAQVYQTAREQNTLVVVGGRALTEEVRREMTFSAYGDNLSHLVAFLGSLQP